MNSYQRNHKQKVLKSFISQRAYAIRLGKLDDIACFNSLISKTIYSLVNNVWL